MDSGPPALRRGCGRDPRGPWQLSWHLRSQWFLDTQVPSRAHPCVPGDGPWEGNTRLLWARPSQDPERHQTSVLGGRRGQGGACHTHRGRLPALPQGAVPPTWPALSQGPCAPRQFCGTLMPLRACPGEALGASSVSEVTASRLSRGVHSACQGVKISGLRCGGPRGGAVSDFSQFGLESL